MRRGKSHPGAFTNKLVTCLTLSGGGGLGRDIWHMTESRCIHGQELLLLALLLILLAMGILNDLPGLTSCRCDNTGLVSSLGWELRVISLYYVYKES